MVWLTDKSAGSYNRLSINWEQDETTIEFQWFKLVHNDSAESFICYGLANSISGCQKFGASNFKFQPSLVYFAVYKNKTPVWDKENKKWITKNSPPLENFFYGLFGSLDPGKTFSGSMHIGSKSPISQKLLKSRTSEEKLSDETRNLLISSIFDVIESSDSSIEVEEFPENSIRPGTAESRVEKISNLDLKLNWAISRLKEIDPNWEYTSIADLHTSSLLEKYADDDVTLQKLLRALEAIAMFL